LRQANEIQELLLLAIVRRPTGTPSWWRGRRVVSGGWNGFILFFFLFPMLFHLPNLLET